jgi:hypothetical protein
MHRRKVTNLEKHQSAFMGYSQHGCKWLANLTFIDNYKGSMNFHITINLLSKTKVQKLCGKKKKKIICLLSELWVSKLRQCNGGTNIIMYNITIFKLSLA